METKNEILMKNNALIKARYDITTYENKLFILLLYKLQKINETTCSCVLKVSEIKEKINARTVKNKKEIGKLLSNLRKRPIFFKEGENWGEYGFINGYKYDSKSNSFIIEASEEVYKLLREYLENGYTPVNLEIWLGLKSSYAQRFYDFLRLWSNTKTNIEYSLIELREFLMLEDKYKEYRDFKRRVISPAVKELNETGYFEIDFKENKVGRKVESIGFIVKDLDSRTYFNKINEAKPKNNIIQLDESKVKIIDKKVTESKDKSSKFYVPNKKLFTAKTLENLKRDFGQYNFDESDYKELLQKSIFITLEKDDEEKIKVKSYNYFKSVLENKLKEVNKTSKVKTIKTTHHNINQTFTKYSDDELEKLLIDSQKQKFK